MSDHPLVALAVGIGPVIYLFEGRRAVISRLLQSAAVAEQRKLSDRLVAFSLFPGELFPGLLHSHPPAKLFALTSFSEGIV